MLMLARQIEKEITELEREEFGDANINELWRKLCAIMWWKFGGSYEKDWAHILPSLSDEYQVVVWSLYSFHAYIPALRDSRNLQDARLTFALSIMFEYWIVDKKISLDELNNNMPNCLKVISDFIDSEEFRINWRDDTVSNNKYSNTTESVGLKTTEQDLTLSQPEVINWNIPVNSNENENPIGEQLSFEPEEPPIEAIYRSRLPPYPATVEMFNGVVAEVHPDRPYLFSREQWEKVKEYEGWKLISG